MATTGTEFGNYITLSGKRRALKKHDTDFSVQAEPEAVVGDDVEEAFRISRNMARVHTAGSPQRDETMAKLRERKVAHHIYQIEETDEEIVITDKVILEMKREDAEALRQIMNDYKLKYVSEMGGAHILRVTAASAQNPLKIANQISERDIVASCVPELVVEVQLQSAALFPEQWYLTTDLVEHPEVAAGADTDVPEAWEITTGNPDIVVAVIDDGFDLEHPTLRPTRLHPSRHDFKDNDVNPAARGADYHGTPVASIAIGAHTGGAMKGIAPGCTFLPMRIGFGPGATASELLGIFQFASRHADVVNCSFATPPLTFDPFEGGFRRAMTELARTGGRRGKGLVMVFSAANDDAPTFLDGAQNISGVSFAHRSKIRRIGAGEDVYSGYPTIPGVIVVSAMSSLKRKAGYSCWGPHITVTAPSDNMHYIQEFTPLGTPGRASFVATYPGLGQVAAVNRRGFGSPFKPISRIDNASTPDIREDHYTKQFGGTSGAAPVVTGVVALMLSVNPQLSARDVRQILMSTADKQLDPTLDLVGDPNVQGLTGHFVNGHSLWFGAGKVNAAGAVRRARALNHEYLHTGAASGVHAASPAPQPSHAQDVSPVPANPITLVTPYDVAKAELVLDIREVTGPGNNPRIVMYHETTNAWSGTDDSVPWCSSFVNYCVEQAGRVGTDSQRALDWQGWGQDVSGDPREGDIAVFQRGGAGGHVGFIVEDLGTHFSVLGGNQSNRVRISNYPKAGDLGGTSYVLRSVRRG